MILKLLPIFLTVSCTIAYSDFDRLLSRSSLNINDLPVIANKIATLSKDYNLGGMLQVDTIFFVVHRESNQPCLITSVNEVNETEFYLINKEKTYIIPDLIDIHFTYKFIYYLVESDMDLKGVTVLGLESVVQNDSDYFDLIRRIV